MENNLRELPERLVSLSQEYGRQVSLLQITELYNAVLNTPEGDIVEIGSSTGGTTVVLVEAANEKAKRVYSVDPYPEELEGVARDYEKGSMKIAKETFNRNILHNYPQVTQFNTQLKDCIDQIPDNISVAFVDGLHELSYVKEEYLLLLPKMVKGGLMYFHDMGFSMGQLSKEGGLTEFPKWVQKGEIVEKDIRSRLEALQQMLKIEI